MALVATGCKKDNIDPTHVRILSEKKTEGNGGKVWVDPTQGNTSSSASWNEDEPININGSNFVIEKKGGNYYLDGVPTDDTVGQISGDVDVKYSSEMHFVMQTDGNPGVTIPNSGSKTFCVPVTVSTVKRLTISGYDNSGNQLFVATKEMSNIPVI